LISVRLKSFDVFILLSASMDQNNLVEWLYTRCPDDLKPTEFQHGLNRAKILGVLARSSQGCTRGTISKRTKIPIGNLGGYLSKMAGNGLVVSTRPYQEDTRYEITDHGKKTFGIVVETAIETKRFYDAMA